MQDNYAINGCLWILYFLRVHKVWSPHQINQALPRRSRPFWSTWIVILQYVWLGQFVFRCGSISSTYPCLSVGWWYFRIPILSAFLIALREKLKKADPKYFSILGRGVFDPKNFNDPKTFFDPKNKLVWPKKNFWPKNFFDPKTFFVPKNFFDPKILFLTKKLFWPKNFFDQKTFLTQKLFWPKIFFWPNYFFLTKIFFWTQKFF